MVISVALYATGTPFWVFAIAFLTIFAYLLSRYSGREPGIAVWRSAYVTLFACWVGVAIFFGLSALVRIGTLPPSVTSVAVLGGGGLVMGNAIGDWVGRRWAYVPPGQTS